MKLKLTEAMLFHGVDESLQWDTLSCGNGDGMVNITDAEQTNLFTNKLS